MGNETLLLVSKWGGDTLLYQLNQFWFRKGCEEFFCLGRNCSSATESNKDFDYQQRENLLAQNSPFCVSLEFTHFQLEERIRTRD